MANARAVIDIDVNTSPAAAGLRSLQSQINAFSSALNKANTEQALAAKGMARQLSDLVNSSKFFTAETVRMQTSAAQLDSTLKKGQVTMGQFFSAKFRKDGLAAAQVMSLANARASALQTQFIQVGAAANGMRDALAIRPLQAFNSAAAVSAQTLAVQRAMLQQATTSMINFGKNTQWAGRQLMVGFTVPLTIFGGMAAKTFKELEAEAINFKKVYGDIFTTDAETQAAMDNVQALASEFTKYGIAVKDTMALAGVAAQSGLRNAELMAATTQATRLATLGQMEQADAMKTIISLQTAFKASNEELAESVDFLNIIENQTVLSLQDVAGAIPRVAPVIQGLGGDVKDLAVLLVAMKEGGVSAGEGANALKSSLGRLITPTKRALDMAAGFGINLEKIVQNNRGQVVPMIQELAQAMSSLEGLEQQQLLSTLFGKFQYARIGALFKSLTDDSSQAARAMGLINMEASQLAQIADKELSVVEEATGTKMVAAMERLKVAIAPIGEMFLKMATPIINFLASIAEKFNSLPDFAKKFIGLATVLTGLVIPAGTMFLGLLMNLVGTLVKFGHIIGIAFKGFLSGGFKGAFDNVSQALKYMSLQEIDAANAATQLAGTTRAVNAALLDQVGRAEASTAAVMGLAGAYDILVQNMRESMLVGGLPMAVPGQAGLKAGSSGLRYRPLPIVKRNKGGSIPYLSDGGKPTVPGMGNKDTVPAMLTPGEFVVNKQATQQNIGLLHAINNGDVQYRNRGGGIAKSGREYYGARPNPFALAAQQARTRLEQFESSRSAIAQTFGLPVGGAGRASGFGTIRATQVSNSRRSRDIFDAVVGTNTKAARMLRAAESLGISKDEMGLKQVGNLVLAMSPSSNVRMANGNLAKQRLLTELENPGAFSPLSQQLRRYFGKSLDDKLFDQIYREQIALLPESGITNALFEKATRNALRVYLDRSGFDRASRKAFLKDILSPDSVRGNLTRDRLRQALRSNGITPNESGGDIKAIINGEEFNFGDLTGRTFTRLGRPQGITRYDDLVVGEGLERVHANKGGLIPGVQYLVSGGVTAALRSMLSSFSVKSSSARAMLEGIATKTRNAPSAFRTLRKNLIGDEVNTDILKDAARLGGWKSKGLPMPSRYRYLATAHIEEDRLSQGKFWQARNLRYTSNAENDILNNLFKNASSSKKKSILSILGGADKDFTDRLMQGYHPSTKKDYRTLDRILTKIQKSPEFKNIFSGRYDEADIAIMSGLAKLRYSTSKSAKSLRSQIDDPFNMFTGNVLTVEDLLSGVTFRNKGGIIPGFARGGALMSRAAQLKAIREAQGFGILGSNVEDKSLRSIFRLGFNDTRTDNPSDFVRAMFSRWETTPTRISPKENTTMLLKGKKPKYAPVSQEDYLAEMIMSGNKFSDVVDAFKPITIGRMRGTGETRVFDGHTRIHSQIVKGLIERKLGLSTAGMSKEELVQAIKTIRQMSLDGKITNTDVMRSTSGQRVLVRNASDREVDKLFDHPLRRQPMGSMMNREGRTLIPGIHDAEIESIVNAARKANFYGVGKDTESLMRSMGFVSLGGGSRFRYEPGADFRNRSSYINNVGRRIVDDLIDRREILPLRRNMGGIIPKLARGGPIGLLRSYMAGNFDIMRDSATRRSVMSLATPVTGTFYRGTQVGSGALPRYLEKELLRAEKTGDYSKLIGKTFKMRSSDWSTNESTAARFMQMNRAKEKQDFLNYERKLVTRQIKEAEEYIDLANSGRLTYVNRTKLNNAGKNLPMLRKDLERINKELADLGELSPLLIKASGTIKGVEASKLVPDATYLGRAINEDNIISSGGMFQIKSASSGKLEIIPAQARNSGGEIFESAKKTIVPGVGNTDTVPAALTPGEFVINKQATQANKPLLQAINSGKAIAMNKGGLIPGMQYLNPGGMAQRLAQQSRAMSSKSIYTKSEVEDIFGNIRPTYRLKNKDQEYMFRGYGEKPGVIGKTSTVKELEATPESLLTEAIALNPNDPKLKSMLSNFKNKNFGKDEVSLLDDIAGAMAINKQGEFSAREKTSGLALVLAALSGDQQARSSVNIKKQAFYRKVEEARKKEIEKNKDIEAKSEAASLDELAFVHSTRHKIDRGSDGTITLKPAAYHRLGTEESYPRSSVHFTINSKVQDHVMGSWDAANKLIVTSGRKVIDANNNPAALRSIDTFWEIGPGENMVLRNASVVSPHNDQSIYKRELMNRGIADVDGQLPFLVDDAARNDVLYFTKAADDYTDADRIRILQDLGKTQREAEILAATIQGQENSLIEREALKRAMQQQKVAAEPETLGQWGYNYNTELDSRIAALAKRRGISGEIHDASPAAQLEKSAVMPMGYDYNRFSGGNLNSYRWLIASGHTKTRSTSPKANLNFMDGNTGGMVPGVQYFARNMLQRVVQPLRGPAIIANERQKRSIERKLALWLGGGMKNVNIRELTSLGLARRQQETELFRGMPIRSLAEGSSPRFTPEVHEALYRYARTKDPKELDGIIGRPIAIGARSFSKSKKTAEEFAENVSEKDASFVFKIRDEKGIYGIDPYQKLGTGRQSESYRDLRREYKRKEKEIIPVGSPEKGRPDVVVGRIALDKDGFVVIDTGAKLSRREIATVTREYDDIVGARFTPRSVITTAEDEMQKLWAQYQRLKHRQSRGESISSKEAGDLYAAISRLGFNIPQDGTLNLRTNREIKSLVRMRESISTMSEDLASIFNAARAAGLNNGGFISPTLKMNNGNMVPGVGNTDTVPAMLTPGEFVVNQKATQENLPLLHAINSGRAVGMNRGGKIPGVQYLVNGGQVYKMLDGWYADDGKGGVRGPYRTEMSAGIALRRMGGGLLRSPSGSGVPGSGMARGMGISMAGSMGGMGLMTIGENMKQSAIAEGRSPSTGEALSNAGMFTMMGSQLAFLPPSVLGPLLAIGAPIAAVAGGLALMETQANNAAMAASEMAAGINGTIHPLKKMGEFLNIPTPAQKQAQINLGISQQETETFQQQFGEVFSTEEGMLFVDELKRATSDQRFEKLSNYLKYAVASEMMDRESAKTFARVISAEIGDSFLGARISSILSKQGSGSSELLNLGLERDLQAQQKKAIENVKSSEERTAAGLLGGVSIEDSAAAITLSSLALQDFSNASALAFEELTSGQISVEEYQKVVDESRRKQGEYTRVLVEAIDKTGKFGSSMQVLKDQFVKMGFDESMFKDIEANLVKSSEKQSAQQLEEMGYWQRQWALVRDRLSLETLTAIGPPTTRNTPEENMAEDVKNNIMPYVSAAIFEGMEPMLAQNIGIEILVNDGMDENFENIAEKFGARLALESEIVMKKINEGEVIDFTTGIDQTADRIPQIIANRKEQVEQIFDEFIDRGGKPDQFLTWLQSIPEEKSFELVVEFGGLSKREQQDYLSDVSSFAQAYGQEFQLAFQQSDFYKNLLGKGTTRGLRESLSLASETGLSERVINYSIKESSKETTPDQLANRIDSLTNSFIRLESLPEEVRKVLRIDLESGIDLERFGPYTEEIQSGWELIDSLDADVAKELVANAILLDGQGNVRSFEDMAYEIGNLNIAYRSLENLSPEIRKQAIIDIATNLGEGDPNAILGRVLADIPDFYQLGGGQQAFILEQYGQAFSRTQEARDALEENERQRQEILDKRSSNPGDRDYGQEDLDRLNEERISLEKTTEGYMAYEQARAAAIASGAGFTVGPDLMGALGLSYTDDVFKNNAKEIADAWDIMQGLPQELDLSLVARFMVFGNGDTPLDAEEVAKQGKILVKAFRNLQSEDPEKRMAGQEAIGLAYAMQVMGGPELVDENGESVSAEEVRNRAFEELKAQFPDFSELSIEVQGAMITSRIDYIVEGAEIAARNAQLEQNLKSALAAGDYEAARMISRQIDANNATMKTLKEKAAAVSEVQYRKPPKTTGSGGGGGEKSISDQMKDQLDLLQDTYDGLDRFINSKTGVFKKFISGPFGPQFIEFLKSQGKKGIDILKGDLDKFKKLYGQYLAIQMQSAENAIQILPQSIKSQTMQAVGMRMITDRLGKQGFNQENVEMVMSQFEDPAAIAEAYAVARRRKGKGKSLTDEQQELLDMFSPGNMKQILNQIKKFNAEAREQFVQTKEEALDLENEFRNTLEGRNISPEVIDMLLEMGYTSKDLETNLEAIVGHAQRLDSTLAQTKFADSMEGMNREVDQANFALELMGQGIGPEAAAAISQIGLAGQLTNEQIQEFAKTFEELQILQMAMQDPAQLRLQQLQGQENINQLKYEIELLENINKNETMSALYTKEKVDNHEDLLEVYERENDLKSREIELRQRALEPIDEEITKLEEQKTTLEETYQEQFEALDQILEKENEIFATRERMLNVAQALSRGDVAEAATAAIELERQRAEQRRQDQRSALELQRQQEMESIDDKINNAKDRRRVIEEDIKRLQLEQRAIQDQIYNTQFIINEEAARLEDKYKLGNNQLAILRSELALAEADQRKLNDAIAAGNRIRQQALTSAPAPAPSGPPPASSYEPGSYYGATQSAAVAAQFTPGALSLAAQLNAGRRDFNAQQWETLKLIEQANKAAGLMYGGSVNYRGSREAPPGFMYGGKMKKYAVGSWVGGTGMVDSVPAMLTPGEFVVRRPVAQAYGPLLESLNGKVFPRVNFGKAMPSGSAGDSGSMYNYSVNVTLNGADMNPDEVANAVMKKIKMSENTRVRGYNTRG